MWLFSELGERVDKLDKFAIIVFAWQINALHLQSVGSNYGEHASLYDSDKANIEREFIDHAGKSMWEVYNAERAFKFLNILQLVLDGLQQTHHQQTLLRDNQEQDTLHLAF